MPLQAGGGDTAGVPWGDALGMGDGRRRNLSRSPRPQNGSVLRETPDMEHGTPHSLYKDPKSLISWGCSESWVEMYFQTMT